MAQRVLLAGLFHETHTFLEGETTLADFEVRRGAELLGARGDGSPLAAVVEVAEKAGWELIPAIDLRATPSATVADEVVELFWSELSAAAKRQLAAGLDGVFLVLHGAMASRSFPDAEGELLSRLQNLPGISRLPVCGVTDLHANFSAAMTAGADGLVAYRNNPHTDAHAASAQAARLLDRLLTDGRRARTVWERPALMWPPTGLGTANDPMRTLEAMAREIEARFPEIVAANIYGGYSFADTPDTGVSFTAVTLGDEEAARRELRLLSDWAWQHRQQGNVVDPPLASVLPLLKNAIKRPILLVEPSDNIGGGAPGDGVGVLRALLAEEIADSGVIINDAAAAAACHAAAPGARLRLGVGGAYNRMAGGPVEREWELVSLSDGRFEVEDRHSHLVSMCGVQIDMGPCAVVRHGGVTVLLTSRKTPPFDLGQWRSQGIHPEKLAVIGVKAAVAHRQAYDKIAAASYTIDTPGPCSSNLAGFAFHKLRRPVYPLDSE